MFYVERSRRMERTPAMLAVRVFIVAFLTGQREPLASSME
jgi:hypothetical protein